MVNIVVLGNCSGLSAIHNTTSYVIETDVTKILLDTGPGLVQQLKRADIPASEIGLVIVTHCHCDHTLEFPYFLFSNLIDRTLGKTGPEKIPVIALGPVFKGLMDMVAFTCPPGKFPFDIYNWEASASQYSSFDFQGIEVTTIPVTHSVPNIGVRFKIGPTRIVFSSDTVYNKSLVELAKGCDVLVHEAFAPSSMGEFASQAGHATAEEAGKAARDAGAKMLILSHMLPIFIEQADILISEAGQHFSGKIIVPSELDTINIS